MWLKVGIRWDQGKRWESGGIRVKEVNVGARDRYISGTLAARKASPRQGSFQGLFTANTVDIIALSLITEYS